MFIRTKFITALFLFVFPVSVFATMAIGPITAGHPSAGLTALLDVMKSRDTAGAKEILGLIERIIASDEVAIVLEAPDFEYVAVHFMKADSVSPTTGKQGVIGTALVLERKEKPQKQCSEMKNLSPDDRIGCYTDGISYGEQELYFHAGGDSVKDAIEQNAELFENLLAQRMKVQFLREAKLEDEVQKLKNILYITESITPYVFEYHSYRMNLEAPLLWGKTDAPSDPAIAKLIKGGHFLAEKGLVFLDINHSKISGLSQEAIVIEKEKYTPGSYYKMGYDLEQAFDSSMEKRGFHYVDGEWK